MNKTVDAILMASGFSKRFGTENKLTKKFNNLPLAQYTLNLVCNSQLYENIYFITAQPEVAILCKNYPVQLIQNNAPEKGQCESIRLGATASKADFLHFFTCDQPLLTTSVLQNILENAKIGYITQPTFKSIAASPTLFSNTFVPELKKLNDGETGKAIKKRYPNNIISVEISNGYDLRDIDTPEEFKELEKVIVHKTNT